MNHTTKSWASRDLGKDPSERTRLLPSCHKRKITTLAWCPSGKRLASGCDGSEKSSYAQLIVWRLDQRGPSQDTQETTAKVSGLHDNKILAIAWDPLGARRLLSWITNRSSRSWTSALATQSSKPTFQAPTAAWTGITGDADEEDASAEVNDVQWSRDGKQLYVARDTGSVEVYSYPGMQFVHDLQGHVGIIWSFSLSQNGRTLAMAGDDACISIWDMHSLCCTRMLTHLDAPVLSLDLSRNGRLLALALSDGSIAIHDVDTGRMEHQRECIQDKSAVKAGEAPRYAPELVSWNPQQNTLAYRGPYYDLADQQPPQHPPYYQGGGYYHQPAPPPPRMTNYGLVTLLSAPGLTGSKA
ncbi:hypothetical protein WJX84_010488 [Apatococcus fuscideae]|uniref:Anaphase-promoting complex subunit 4-like WD40 domain-containing protein n=1 Tax=Apatococcus fuscideae TaxID=2026836 RepID=A0AAW1RXV9_9CHLO